MGHAGPLIVIMDRAFSIMVLLLVIAQGKTGYLYFECGIPKAGESSASKKVEKIEILYLYATKLLLVLRHLQTKAVYLVSQIS